MARRTRRLSALLLSSTLLGVSTSACGSFADIRLTQDHRVSIQSPRNLQRVSLPLHVRWTADDPAWRSSEQGGSQRRPMFAVLVDRYPMAPGRSLKDLVDDPTCDADPKCPSKELLELNNVYVTERTSVVIPSVPSGNLGGDAHQLTIVLIDRSGHRIGDSFWNVSFTVDS